MTRNEAITAMENRTKVQAGDPNKRTSDGILIDYDTGYIVDVASDMKMATVAWDSGVRTPCHLADLKRV